MEYELFIGGQKCDLTDDVVIALSYTSIDTDTPTAEHGSYSKSVELPGTSNNNDIFGSAFILSRSVREGNYEEGGIYFDPRKRTPYTLWDNGDIIDSGYIKLDSVNNNDGDITYSCTLYGDKNNFFLNLMYDDEGNEKNLTDLKYNLIGVSGQTIDEENGTLLIWDKDYIYESWGALGQEILPNDMRVQNYITAAPTYSGYHDDFDNSKVLVLRSAMATGTDATRILAQFSDTAYTPYLGWSLVEATRDLDEWEVMDIRSNYQRPAVKMSLILDAISNPENNGGYTVIWDDEIKNSPYYQKSYLLMNKFDFDSDETVNGFLNLEYSGYTNSRHRQSWYSSAVSSTTDSSTVFNLSGYSEPSATLTFKMTLDNDIAPMYNYGNFYTAYFHKFNKGEAYVYGGLLMRADVYSGDTKISETPNYLITTDVYNSDKAYGYGAAAWKTQIAQNCGIDPESIVMRKNTIYFDKSVNKLRFGEDITIKVDLPTDGQNISIKVSNTWAWYTNNTQGYVGIAYQSLASKKGWMSFPNAFGYLELVHDVDNKIESGVYDSSNPFIQKTQVTKQILFGETESPYTYLVGFTRMIGAKYRYDLAAKKIHINARNTYYLPKGHVIDKLIDRGQDIEITPTLSEYKWCEYGFETPETYAAQLYNRRNKIEYGKKKVDTGYLFNNESNNLFEDIPYTNAIPYLLKSIYFNNYNGCPSALLSPTMKMTQFKLNGTELEKKEQTIYGYGGFYAVPNRYDWSGDKLCCFDDSNDDVDDVTNCLCFFDGFSNTDKKFQITDNLPIMQTLNDNACYLCLSGATQGYADKDDVDTTEIAKYYDGLPVFSKYLRNADGVYTDSLDFMKPNYTFIGNSDNYADGICIYDRYWSGYISDIYEKDNKAVTVRYFLQDKPDGAMRRFYYFDNAIWVISEITDYDSSRPDPTQVKFIKVYDTRNYTDGEIEWDEWIEDMYEDIDRPRPVPPLPPDSGDTSGDTGIYVFMFGNNTTALTQNYPSSGGTFPTIVISNRDGVTVPFSAVQRPLWVSSIDFGQPSQGGNYFIEITLDDNEFTNARSGDLIFRQSGSSKEIVWTINQAAENSGSTSGCSGTSVVIYTSGDTSGSTSGDTSGSTSGDTSGSTSGDTSGSTSGDTSGSTSGDTSGSTSGDTSGSTSGVCSGNTIILHLTGGTDEIHTYSSTTTPDYAFSARTDIASAEICNGITNIGNGTFISCTSMTSVTIPNSVTKIYPYAFHSCESLTSVTIPSSVTTIYDLAFGWCTSMTSVTIPSSVTTIKDMAFAHCTSLNSILVESNNSVYDSRENCNAIIKTDTNTLIAGCKNSFIPSSVTEIGDYAFYQCTSLTSVTIPNSVTSIGIAAFAWCSGLTSITIPSSVTTIDDGAFARCTGLTSLTIPSSVTSIGNGTFSRCTGLRSVAIPSSVTYIGREDFSYCTSLTSVTIPNSVTDIEQEAFVGCTSLTSVNIGNSVTEIGWRTFGDCTNLNSITISATTAPTITGTTFDNVATGGTLYYPCGSDYSTWLSNNEYYLGYYGWSGVCFNPTPSGS